MSLHNVKVGDHVMVTDTNLKGTRKALVTRVGRKYVYTGEGRRETGFDKDTGRSRDEWGHGHAMPMQEHYENERACLADKELRAFGVSVDNPWNPAKVLAVREALDVVMSSWVGR